MKGSTKNFYEEQVKNLCLKAKASGQYLEGERREDGCPIGMTAWAVAAKCLWLFDRYEVRPLSIEEAQSVHNVFQTFEKLFELPRGLEENPLNYTLKEEKS